MTSSGRRCKVCGGRTTPLFVKEYALFGSAEYRRCESCSFVFSDHIERARKDIVTGFYRDCSFGTEDPGYVSRARTAYSVLTDFARRDDLRLKELSLLDYGCGEGTFLSICRENGLDARGYDPYTGGGGNPGGRIQRDEVDAHKGSFHLVTCFEVVEHAVSPSIFETLLDFLKPGGHLVFSTGIYNRNVHGQKWEYFVPAHCSIYSVRSLEFLAGNLGAQRKFLLRHPFVDIPYLLTGEIWQKKGEAGASIPDSRTVERIDRSFAEVPDALKKRLFRTTWAWIYRRGFFI